MVLRTAVVLLCCWYAGTMSVRCVVNIPWCDTFVALHSNNTLLYWSVGRCSSGAAPANVCRVLWWMWSVKTTQLDATLISTTTMAMLVGSSSAATLSLSLSVMFGLFLLDLYTFPTTRACRPETLGRWTLLSCLPPVVRPSGRQHADFLPACLSLTLCDC